MGGFLVICILLAVCFLLGLPTVLHGDSKKKKIPVDPYPNLGKVIAKKHKREYAGEDGEETIDHYYIIVLFSDGKTVRFESRYFFNRLAIGDYGKFTVKGWTIAAFERKGVLGIKDCSAVLVRMGNGCFEKEPEGVWYLIFRSDAFKLYGRELVVRCSYADYMRWKPGTRGKVSILRDRLQSFIPDSVRMEYEDIEKE